MSHGILADPIVQRMFIPSLDLIVQCWIHYHYAIFRPKSSWWMHLIAFFAIDFFYYWLHRAAHEINFIWATHQVHHSSERYVCILHHSSRLFCRYILLTKVSSLDPSRERFCSWCFPPSVLDCCLHYRDVHPYFPIDVLLDVWCLEPIYGYEARRVSKLFRVGCLHSFGLLHATDCVLVPQAD